MSGAGGKAFCAGGNLIDLYNAHISKNLADKTVLLEFFEKEFQLDYQLSLLQKTRQISVWDGIVMGAGVGLTWHSPIRIATENSVYAMPETAIGYFVDVGASYFLPRIKNDISLGLFLGLTGHRLRA